jgi:NADPH:quinone reductase-like Zn-dependent oxidoreductase
MVTGLDVAGVVEAVGPGVSRLRVGHEVWGSTVPGYGTCAELAVVPADHLGPRPASLDPVEAASLPMVGLTALQALEAGGARPGHRLLVLGGSGGVGTAAIQIARARGLTVAVTCSPQNADLVEALGVDTWVDYTTADPARRLPPQDRVLDAVGDPDVALRCVRRGGAVVAIVGGVASLARRFGPVPGLALALGRMAWNRGRAAIRGRRVLHLLRRPGAEGLAELGQMVEAGRLRPSIQAVYPLAGIRRAHAHVESGRTRGKVVVRIR